MKFNSFDMQIHSDEFASEYEDFLRILDEEWEEPEEWKNMASSSNGQEVGLSRR